MYRAGTVSIENDSHTVSGIDTHFTSVGNVQPGALITFDGQALYYIRTVVSDTMLEIESPVTGDPYAGPALTDADYGIFQPVGTGFTGAVAIRTMEVQRTMQERDRQLLDFFYSTEPEITVTSYSGETFTLKTAQEIDRLAAAAASADAITGNLETRLLDVESSLDTLAPTVTGYLDDAQSAASTAIQWASEAVDVEVVPGAYSARHYQVKAQALHDVVLSINDDIVDTYLPQTQDNVEKARKWAIAAIGSAVEPGKYSALHYADLSAKWARAPKGAAVGSGFYSAMHYSLTAKDWAETEEDTEVTTGQYSARHHAIKAGRQATAAGGSASAAQDSETLASQWATHPPNTDIPGSPGSYSARHHAQNAGQSATKSEDFATTAPGVDVPGQPTGTRSARHYADTASQSAAQASQTKTDTQALKATAESAASTATDKANQAGNEADRATMQADRSDTQADRAQAWAQTAPGQDVAGQGAGSRSARHYADAASQSADAASDSENNALGYANEARGYRDAAQQAAQSMAGTMFFGGDWDASSGTTPTAPVEGSAFYKITVAGTINGESYNPGDNLVYNNISGVWFKVDNTENGLPTTGGTVTGYLNVENTLRADKLATRSTLQLETYNRAGEAGFIAGGSAGRFWFAPYLNGDSGARYNDEFGWNVDQGWYFDNKVRFHGGAQITSGGTIAGSNWHQGWLRIGSASVGWSIDSNEIYSAGQATIGSLADDLILKSAGKLDIQSSALVNGALSVSNGKFNVTENGTDVISLQPKGADQYVGITYRSEGGTTRWLLYQSNDADQDFFLQGRANDGSYQHTTFRVDRASGELEFKRDAELVDYSLWFGSGRHSRLIGQSNNLYIENTANDIVLDAKSAIYQKVDGSAMGYWFNGGLKLFDNKHVRLGSDNDFRMYASGGNAYFDMTNGNMYFRALSSGNDIHFEAEKGNGDRHRGLSVQGGSSGVYAYLYGGSENFIAQTVDDGLEIQGGNKLKFGDGNIAFWKTASNLALRVNGDTVMRYDPDITYGYRAWSTNGMVEAGRGSGSLAMTLNDGHGNCNLTFNHVDGVPDVDGNAARIIVNVDYVGNADMSFELASGVVKGQEVSTNRRMELQDNRLLLHTGRLDIGGTKLENVGDNELRVTTDHGWVEIGPQNSSYVHFRTDRDKYYFDTQVHITQKAHIYNTDTYLQGYNSQLACGNGGMGVQNEGASAVSIYQATDSSNRDAFMTFHCAGRHATHFGLNWDKKRLMTGGYSDAVNRDVLTRRFIYNNNGTGTINVSPEYHGNDAVFQLWVANGLLFTLDPTFLAGDMVTIISNNPAAGGVRIVNPEGKIYAPDGSRVNSGEEMVWTEPGAIRLVKYADTGWMMSKAG